MITGMKKLLSALIILLIFAAFTSIAPGITGTWTATISGPNGEAEITYYFEAEEDTLTGAVVGGMGEVEIRESRRKRILFRDAVQQCNNFA